MLLLVAGAALLSAVVSFFALRRFREDYSAQLAARLDERAAAKQAHPAPPTDEDAEDAEVSGDDGNFR